MNKKKYAAIDIAKYVAALLVVCIHTYPFIDISETFNTYWMHIVCRLAVPFFFTVSGFFFFRKYEDGQDENNLENLKGFIKRLLIIYGIWTVIYLPYTIINYISAGAPWYAVLGWIRDALINGSYYHLWFFPALMIGTFIVYELYKREGLINTIKIAAILYGIGYFINIYASIWESLPIVSILYGFIIKLMGTARNGFFFAPIFIALGLLLARTKRLPNKTSALGFGASFVLLAVEVLLYGKLGLLHDLSSMFLLLVPAVYFLVNWLLTVKMPYKKQYAILRKDSLLIYTSHVLFARLLFIWIPDANLVVFFLTLACSQAFASLVVRGMEKYPILENLV